MKSGALLTVDELISSSHLDLTLVGGKSGSDAAIDQVYVGDLENPVQWMAPGSLLLTTGRVFRDDPSVGVQMIRSLHDSGMAGMCIAITPYIDEIDPSMIRVADELGIGLIKVPASTPFRLITEWVHEVLASRDLHRLRMTLSLQNQLLESLNNGGRQGLLRRLSQLTDGSAFLFDLDGRLMVETSRSGAFDLAVIWEGYSEAVAAGRPRSLFDVEDRTVIFREVEHKGAISEVLVVVLRSGHGVKESPNAAVTFAHRLLELEQRSEEAVLGRRRTEREELLRILLKSDRPDSQTELRLGHLGMVRQDNWYALAVVCRDETQGVIPYAVEQAVNTLLERERVPFLVLPEEGLLAVVLECAPDVVADLVSQVQGAVQAAGGGGASDRSTCDYCVGVAGPMRCINDVSGTAECALAAASLGRWAGSAAGRIVWFSSLTPHSQMICSLPPQQLKKLADAVLRTLRHHDREADNELEQSLAEYLLQGCSTGAAAEALYLHRNAMRKRLARIEALTGLDLLNVEGRAAAFAAFVADAVLETRQHLLGD